MLVVESLACPLGGGAGPPVEPLQVEQPGHAVLVVAGDDRARATVENLDARDRIRAIADAVAETEQTVRARRGIRKHGAQRLEIAVDVR